MSDWLNRLHEGRSARRFKVPGSTFKVSASAESAKSAVNHPARRGNLVRQFVRKMKKVVETGLGPVSASGGSDRNTSMKARMRACLNRKKVWETATVAISASGRADTKVSVR